MTRLTNSTNITASQQAHVPYVLLADLNFASGHVYVNSWDRPYTFNGNTYTGLGKMAAIGDVSESNTINSEQLEFTLSGVDNSLLTTVLGENYRGRDATLYLGYLNPVTYDFAADPEILWEGYMDIMSIKTGIGTSTIKLVCENRLLLWSKTSNWRYTDEDQRLINAADSFFNLLSAQMNKTIVWAGQHVTGGTPVVKPPHPFPRPPKPR